MRFLSALLLGLLVRAPHLMAGDRTGGEEFRVLLERLRREKPGEYEKVLELAKTDRPAALEFLRGRFGGKGERSSGK